MVHARRASIIERSVAPRRVLPIGLFAAAVLLVALATTVPSAASALDPSVVDEPVILDLPDVKPPQIGDPIGEAEMQDLRTVADQRKITLDEAIERYAWHDDFAMAVGEIRTSQSDAYAHAVIDAPDSAEIWFSGDAPDKARAVLADFERYFPHVSVTVRTGHGMTENEIDDAVVAAHVAVHQREEVDDASTWYDHETRQVTVVIPASRGPLDRIDLASLEVAASTAVDAAVGEARLRGVTVRVTRSNSVILSRGDSSSRHHGGEALNGCTSGFGTRDASPTSGMRGISTAGHCSDSQSDDGDQLTFVDDYDHLFGDFQLHTGPDLETDDFYSGNSSTLEVYLRDLSGFGVAVNGQWLCRNGKTSKKDCQQVRKNSVCSGANCYMLQMGEDLSAGGDSGAPVFWGPIAYGLHEGWMYDPFWPFDRDTVSRADMLHEALPNWHWATS